MLISLVPMSIEDEELFKPTRNVKNNIMTSYLDKGFFFSDFNEFSGNGYLTKSHAQETR